MTAGRSEAAQRFLRVLFEAGAVGGLTDAELLDRFLARDPATSEPAFAVLVERHGPLVARVCRGILRDQHLAEDAFQSTFLVLVRKASFLRVGTTLAPWLHAVAYRVACEARSNAARRFKHERRAAELATEAQLVENDSRDDLEHQLQEAIAKLTELYRRPIVLCDLEGLTHEQAARLLGTPVGTIKSRLARGREQLRERLSRPGRQQSASALSASLAGESVRSELQSALVDRTAHVAMLVAQSQALAAGMVPASVAILVRGVLKSMLVSRLRTVAVVLATTAGIVISIGFTAHALLARVIPPRGPGEPPLATTIVAGRRDLSEAGGLVRSVAFSRDGRHLITALSPLDDVEQPGEIRVWDTRSVKRLPSLKLDGDPFAMAVAPDSQTLAVAIACNANTNRSFKVRIVDLPSRDTKKEWTLKEGVDVWALAFAPDGKSLLGGIGGLKDGRFYGEVRLWDPAAGTERRTLTGHSNPVMSLAFSQGGRILASASGTYGAPYGEVRLWDIHSGRLLHTLTEPDTAVVTVAFSSDDKTVASGGTIWRDGKTAGVVTLWDVATGEKRMRLPGFPSYVHAVSFAPKGSLLATAGIGAEAGAEVALWDASTGKRLRTFAPYQNVQQVSAVKCMAFAPDGQSLVAGGASGKLSLWEVKTGD